MSPVRTAPARLTNGDPALRVAYLTEVIGLLYPDCVSGPADQPGEQSLVAEYHVIPDRHRPRLLVPAGMPRIAAGAVHAAGQPGPTLGRLKRGVAAAALRSGLSGVLLPDRIRVTRDPHDGQLDTIETHLLDVLGRDLSIAVHIGPSRPSRKPLLQLLTPDGQTFGFTKLGISELTSRLVRLEAAALTAVGHLVPGDVVAPPVLYSGRWRGHEVLVQGALPVWSRRQPVTAERLAAAQREIAFGMGTVRGSVAGSGYWRLLRERLESVTALAVADAEAPLRAQARTLALAADVLVAELGDVELTYGAWHGDWAPWNMATQEYGILLWDWDRFGTGVPVGFDALHYDLHHRMRHTQDAGSAVRDLLAVAPGVLDPFDVSDPAAVRLTTLLYLVDLALRFVDDKHSGGRLGVLGSWLLPELLRAVEER
jgi:hypothetical protein